MESQAGIYQIVGPGGKVYIGQSQNIPRRFKQHKNDLSKNKHHCGHLQHAWSKHGEAAFTFEPLLYLPLNKLTEYEQLALDAHTKEEKYNIAICAEAPARGAIRSEETRQKIRLATTGKKASAISKARMGVAHKGFRHSEETKTKMCENKKGFRWSPEAIARMSATKKGTVITAETRAKISIANKGKKRTAETRAKMSASLKLRQYSAETRAKMSASAKARRARERGEQGQYA